MIKILRGTQVQELDKSYCKKAGISSFDLMERAALSFVNWFFHQSFSKEKTTLIFVGAGNNGGDGLAIARLLSQKNYPVLVVKCFSESSKLSQDAAKNLESLPTKVQEVFFKDFEVKDGYSLLIDAFLGVGLKGELRPDAKKVIQCMNSILAYKVAIDIPSGLPSEGWSPELTFLADLTFTFAFPKMALIMPENAEAVGYLELGDIGIPDEMYEHFESDTYFLTRPAVFPLHKKFHRFSHKGDYGKILLIGGSLGKMGAMVLASKSAMRTGAGLVSCHVEESEHQILQVAVPEVMCNWGLIPNANYYDAIGIGPGWGTEQRKNLLERILTDFRKPLVLDADGLNLLAKYPGMIEKVPSNSILTPHVGEFHRLVGACENHKERMEKALDFSKKYDLILVLKGANSVISFPDGRQVINSTGTPYMATAGAGDALTGMLTAFLGMGYSPESAALCGVFHHGLAGELAGKIKKRGTMASDIIEAIPETFNQLGF